jgi:hypothetical protein
MISPDTTRIGSDLSTNGGSATDASEIWAISPDIFESVLKRTLVNFIFISLIFKYYHFTS